MVGRNQSADKMTSMTFRRRVSSSLDNKILNNSFSASGKYSITYRIELNKINAKNTINLEKSTNYFHTGWFVYIVIRGVRFASKLGQIVRLAPNETTLRLEPPVPITCPNIGPISRCERFIDLID